MRRTLSWWLFWGAVTTAAYTYVGFPMLLVLRAVLWPQRLRGLPQSTPLSVSFIIVAHNEATYICRKLDNALAVNYPRERIEIIVASDGSDDGMNALVAAYPSSAVRLLELPRRGKNPTLNVAVTAASGDIVVFSDADSMLHPDSLTHLLAPFADPAVGGVGGDYHYETASASGAGERSYWSFDRLLKRIESRGGNMISATGQLYAIRRELFQPVPSGVTDDFYTSVRVIAAHRRLVFAPQALVSGPEASSEGAEFQRKVRILTRGFKSVWESRQLLNPRRYGFYALQLFTHKLLRRLMIGPIVVAALTAPLLWGRGWLYRGATVGQLAFHSLALAGFLLRGTPAGRTKLLSLPLFFDMVYIAAVVALVNLLRGKSQDMWVTQRAKPTVKVSL